MLVVAGARVLVRGSPSAALAPRLARPSVQAWRQRALCTTGGPAHHPPGVYIGLDEDSERRVLVTGATGQVGTEFVPYLRNVLGPGGVISSDIKVPAGPAGSGRRFRPFVYCDVTSQDALARIVLEHNVDTIVHLASLLSAVGERNPQLALKVNTAGFHNVMEVARMNNCRVFAPSTIAVFGPSTPKDNTPDLTFLQPTTMYGVTKVHLELLGEYYHHKFGIDFRSLRYPGLISYEAWPGGGTTDWAVEVFYEALRHKTYKCFVGPETALPMMYMPDALRGTLQLIDAPREKLTQCTYNIGALSFTPRQVEEAIQKHIPEFTMTYEPDFRQQIADSWPRSLDDSKAREDWGWQHEFDLPRMVSDILEKIDTKLRRHGVM